jgi:hypothetical protein
MARIFTIKNERGESGKFLMVVSAFRENSLSMTQEIVGA